MKTNRRELTDYKADAQYIKAASGVLVESRGQCYMSRWMWSVLGHTVSDQLWSSDVTWLRWSGSSPSCLSGRLLFVLTVRSRLSRQNESKLLVFVLRVELSGHVGGWHGAIGLKVLSCCHFSVQSYERWLGNQLANQWLEEAFSVTCIAT